jgi:hypothetical protein
VEALVIVRVVIPALIVLAAVLLAAWRLAFLNNALQVDWDIPKYEDLLSVNGSFVSDLSISTRDSYRFRTVGGEEMSFFCYPRGGIRRVYDRNKCLQNIPAISGASNANVTVKYFHIDHGDGFFEDVISEVSSSEGILYPFSESLKIYEIGRNVQSGESSLGPIQSIIAIGIFSAFIIIVFLKEYKK